MEDACLSEPFLVSTAALDSGGVSGSQADSSPAPVGQALPVLYFYY